MANEFCRRGRPRHEFDLSDYHRLNAQGFPRSEIAKRLNVHPRTMQRRVAEERLRAFLQTQA